VSKEYNNLGVTSFFYVNALLNKLKPIQTTANTTFKSLKAIPKPNNCLKIYSLANSPIST